MFSLTRFPNLKDEKKQMLLSVYTLYFRTFVLLL